MAKYEVLDKNEVFQIDDKVTKELERRGVTLRCGLCGQKLKRGDFARYIDFDDEEFQYGNQLVCERCDLGNIMAIRHMFFGLKRIWEEQWIEKFWVFAQKPVRDLLDEIDKLASQPVPEFSDQPEIASAFEEGYTLLQDHLIDFIRESKLRLEV